VKARLLALLALALGAAGCFDPIVGVRCADGYVPCQGHCVAVCSDDAGTQGDGPGGQAGDGSTSGDGAGADGGGSKDASLGTDLATPADAPGADAGTASSDAATDAPAPDAADAGSSPGDAAGLDAAMVDAAVASDALGPDGLAPDMGPPIDCGALTSCPVGCVNLDDDPDNCGACNFSCGTGLCVGGTCQIRPSGHLVVIGHDYAVSRSSMDNLLGNAVFLAPGNRVKVLAYHGAATPQEISGTDAALNRVAANLGRTWVKTVVPAADVPTDLASADVFVIYAQAGATDATLLTLGNDWASALSGFVQAGKIIVVLDGMSANAGTYQIVQQANLFHATGRMDATGQTMVVARPADAIGTRVPRTYRGERSTVWFATMDESVVVQVATDAGTQPVVIHLVF